ncbi:MAG: penicillin-binding protein activator [Bacteroidetes bacterium]|nr:penicillin-binding protein activator [Bacteroidota bacterium]
MKRFNYQLEIITVIVTVMLLEGCHSFEKKNVQIGLIADLSGTMATYGKWVKEGAELAVAEINSNSTQKIDLSFEDSKSDPKSALSALEKLYNINKIRMIVAGNSSSCVMAMAPVVNDKKILLFSTLASSPNITNAGEYVFRNRISGTFESQSMAIEASKLGMKSIAILATNNDAGIPYIKAFTDKFKEQKGEIVASILINPGQSDFRSYALLIKTLRPEAVFLVTTVDQAVNFINQSITIGFTPKWLGISSLKTDQFITNGGKNVEGAIITNEGIDQNGKRYIEFSSKYFKKFGENPTIYAVNGYDAIHLLYESYIRTNNIEMVKYELLRNSFSGAAGIIKFDENGDVVKDLELLKVEGGKFISIK